MNSETVWLAAKRLVEDKLVGDTVTVVWHAGEPLAMPIAFYDEAIVSIREALGPAVQITHSIQTNATLINDAWCRLFKKHDIRVGVSVDGPAQLHDNHRRTRLGRPTHHLVVRGMNLLKSHKIPFHAIAVVTAATIADPDAFFDFFLQNEVEDVSCNIDETEGLHRASSLIGHENSYASFLSRLLERSLECNGQLHIRELDSMFRLISEGLPSYCWRDENWPDNVQVMPFALVTVGWNGDFCTFSPELLGQTSVDFHDFVLGNVNQETYLETSQSDRFLRLWGTIIEGVKSCRRYCKYYNYCGGGAPANKLYENGTCFSTETLYCRSALQQPFEVVLRTLEQSRQGNV